MNLVTFGLILTGVMLNACAQLLLKAGVEANWARAIPCVPVSEPLPPPRGRCERVGGGAERREAER